LDWGRKGEYEEGRHGGENGFEGRKHFKRVNVPKKKLAAQGKWRARPVFKGDATT